MDNQKVELFIATKGKYLDSLALMSIKERLQNLPEDKWSVLQVVELKDPTVVLILSILAGSLGVDRFYIGDTGLGVAKLLTFGGCGIWALVDWFLISNAAKEKNMEKIQSVLA